MFELMKNIYYTPASPGSLGGKKQLKDAILKDTEVRSQTGWLGRMCPRSTERLL